MKTSEYCRTSAPKLCLTCSGGGHLEEMRLLSSLYERYPRFFIVPKGMAAPPQFAEGCNVYRVVNVNEGRGIRNPLLTLTAIAQALVVLLKERPDVILSTGSGIAFPVFCAGVLVGARRIFVESLTRIRKLSKAAAACLPLVNLLLVQHRSLAGAFRKVRYVGSLSEYL
jgi:beta-1,4-N-acetylglucosaminyltransferase